MRAKLGAAGRKRRGVGRKGLLSEPEKRKKFIS
jgi:hypothetical protein